MLLERDSCQEEINNIYQSECDAYKFIRDMRKILRGVRLETETSSLEIQNHSETLSKGFLSTYSKIGELKIPPTNEMPK